MIEIKHIGKSFGKIKAIKDVAFTARDGEITTLLGVNGSGKTTTLRSIAGLIKPDTGSVMVDGVTVAGDPKTVRRNLGYLLDEFGLYARLTTREHMKYFANLHGLRGQARHDAVNDTIALLQIEDIADRRTEGFSLGERSKVALARTLVFSPQNLILDEPSRGLDVLSIRMLRHLLHKLRAEGRCILFSSHVMAEVAELSDRVVIISDGVVVDDDSPASLIEKTNSKNLEDAFVVLTGSPVKEIAA